MLFAEEKNWSSETIPEKGNLTGIVKLNIVSDAKNSIQYKRN